MQYLLLQTGLLPSFYAWTTCFLKNVSQNIYYENNIRFLKTLLSYVYLNPTQMILSWQRGRGGIQVRWNFPRIDSCNLNYKITTSEWLWMAQAIENMGHMLSRALASCVLLNTTEGTDWPWGASWRKTPTLLCHHGPRRSAWTSRFGVSGGQRLVQAGVGSPAVRQDLISCCYSCCWWGKSWTGTNENRILCEILTQFLCY